jgi:urease accessory protein UreE
MMMSSDTAPMTLTEVRGDLILAALCVGQFHAPCQIEDDRLLVKADAALVEALGALGLRLKSVTQTFNPAPMFAPSGATAGHGRRSVHYHVSHLHTDEDETEPPPASNA